MRLAAETKLGPYEILTPIGAGVRPFHPEIEPSVAFTSDPVEQITGNSLNDCGPAEVGAATAWQICW